MSTGQPSLRLPIFPSRQTNAKEADLTNLPPLPSVIPEHLRAPPGTPISAELPNESDNDTHCERHQSLHAAEDVSQDNHFPEDDSEPRGASEHERKSRKRRKRKKFSVNFQPSMILENAGSVARDHLASERTFLAYVRTSLLIASSGVALVQLFAVASANTGVGTQLGQVRKFARPLGATMVIFSLVCLALGVRRYFLIQRYLTQGKFPVTRVTVAAMSIVIAIIILIVFGVLVSARS